MSRDWTNRGEERRRIRHGVATVGASRTIAVLSISLDRLTKPVTQPGLPWNRGFGDFHVSKLSSGDHLQAPS